MAQITSIESLVLKSVQEIVLKLYQTQVEETALQIQETRKEFEGDLTVVVFPLLKYSRKTAEATATDLGNALLSSCPIVEKFNVIKGFLNLVIGREFWAGFLQESAFDGTFGTTGISETSPTVMIEYSSPNTNKPLHLGHIRNNLLGYSLSQILSANGNRVIKVNLVNDRGIHICKSMLAWKLFGNGETPASSGKKGDHLVGDYYVRFDQEYKKEMETLSHQGMSAEDAARKAPLMLQAQEMLRLWEARDPEVLQLWTTMNGWVYQGFETTYRELGVSFDHIYYESQTYLSGKQIVAEGLEKGIFEKRPDGSVWCDLTGDGLDEKLLLRSDGTSVYMTQDIGTACQRFAQYPIDRHIYVVGNEQNYHFQVLTLILGKLGYAWARNIQHMSYGMVELPSGKMKSREGTVVDADDLIADMVNVARKMGQELGKMEDMEAEEADKTYKMIALGALKYFILKVDPKKNMTFNPEESIDFNGNTGPFIQYTHARIMSVLRKARETGISFSPTFPQAMPLEAKEKEILKTISEYPAVVEEAAASYSPALLANYCYEIAREFNQFYHDHSILNEPDARKRNFRLVLSECVVKIMRSGMGMLGIEMPDRM